MRASVHWVNVQCSVCCKRVSTTPQAWAIGSMRKYLDNITMSHFMWVRYISCVAFPKAAVGCQTHMIL